MHKFPLSLEKVKEIGWYVMFENIAQHHIRVTKYFYESFDRSMVKVGGLEFTITDESISHVISIILEGERWYKIQTINEYYSQFMLPAHKNPDWS